MGDKGEEGIKNIKKWVTSFMDGPIASQFFISLNQPRHTQIFLKSNTAVESIYTKNSTSYIPCSVPPTH